MRIGIYWDFTQEGGKYLGKLKGCADTKIQGRGGAIINDRKNQLPGQGGSTKASPAP